jgi:hypothetical protein
MMPQYRFELHEMVMTERLRIAGCARFALQPCAFLRIS